MKVTPILMAGGGGTRLWPVSRNAIPKQFCRLYGTQTMLQETLIRFSDTAQFNPPVIFTHDDYRFIAADQCKEIACTPKAIYLETTRRNTGVVGALAALADPEGLVLLVAADHVIQDLPTFWQAIDAAKNAALQGYIVTFGIKPDRAETAYGYIECDETLSVGNVRAVKRFVEKPNAETAQTYVSNSSYVWNSGMFLATAETLLAEYAQHAPDLLACAKQVFSTAQQDLSFTRFDADVLNKAEAISIDYCLMEKTAKAAVMPVAIGWSDVGTWPAVHALAIKDAQANSHVGQAVLEACENTYVQATAKPVVAVGLKNVAVIDTPDALLIMNMHKTTAFKAAQNRIAQLAPNILEHNQVKKTLWGQIETIETRTDMRTRRVTVEPGQHIAYQSHEKRFEHWLILQGSGRVTLNEQTQLYTAGQSLTITPNMRHGIENTSAHEKLVFLEVQLGAFDLESDVKRYTQEKQLKTVGF